MDVTDQWVDIAYFVTPDGHTRDIGISRQSGTLEAKDWVQLIISAIERRRYMPMCGGRSARRVERFTLTALDRDRKAAPRIEELDLTPITTVEPC